MQLRFRTSRSIGAIALAALIAFVPSCGKKQSGGGGGDVKITPIVNTDHFLFAQLNAKDVRDNAIFNEVRDAFIKQGESKSWDELETQIAEKIGIKPSQIQSFTIVMPQPPGDEKGMPPMILMLASEASIPKQMVFGEKIQPAADRPGFYNFVDGMLVHFPDDKTLVVIHPSLVDPYLGGYALNRSAWPLSPELLNAAQNHTIYASLNPSKLPAKFRNEREFAQFGAFFEAQSATLAIDLRGREIRAQLTGKFPSADAANAAKSAIDKLLGEARTAIKEVLDEPKKVDSIGPAIALVREAHRAITEAKISVNGSELTASASYRVELNVGEMLKSAVDKVRIAAARSRAQNDLRMIGLGIHNYASANGGERLVVYGSGPNDRPIVARPGKDGTLTYEPKPLLSWRVAILPYIDEHDLWQQFKHDQPWDSEHNKKLIDKMPKVYASVNKPNAPGKTHLQQIIGPQCMFPGRFNIGNITDGTSNTIAVIEAAEPVIWTKPDDVYFPETEVNAPPPKDLKKKFGGQFDNGFNVLMWDGSVLFIDSRFVSDSTLWNALRPADGFPLGGDWGR